MTVTIGQTTFDHVEYDEDADVLYLHVGDPKTATHFEESPEGHAWRFDSVGRLVGLTIVNARLLLEHGRPIAITMPERVEVDPQQLAPAIHAA